MWQSSSSPATSTKTMPSSLLGSIFDLLSMSANIVDADALALAESGPNALVCETPMVAMSRAKNTCRRIQRFVKHNVSELEA